VVILDTSGSMSWNVQLAESEEPSDSRMPVYRPDMSQKDRDWLEHVFQEPSRIEVAKASLVNLISELPRNIALHFMTFRAVNFCAAPQYHGQFPYSRRNELTQIVNQLQPFGGTPLTLSLQAAAGYVDGVSNDAVIVLFVDGDDNCGPDICQAAQKLALEKPRLKVNVVDITGFDRATCVAKATGGHVYASQDETELKSMLVQAGVPVKSKIEVKKCTTVLVDE